MGPVMETMRIPADDRSECESDQRECDGHLCYGFVMNAMSLWRSGSAGGRRVDPNLKSRSCAASQRHPQVIDIMHTHLGAGAAMVQAFFFCSSNHSIEPGWGTD